MIKLKDLLLEYDLKYLKKINILEIDEDTLRDIIEFYRNKDKEYFTSLEYKKIYPYLDKIHKEIKRRHKERGEKIMRKAGLEYGDSVYYDYISPFLGVEKYEGIIIKSHQPMVKLTKGGTLSGKKTVKWHTGWKKK